MQVMNLSFHASVIGSEKKVNTEIILILEHRW